MALTDTAVPARPAGPCSTTCSTGRWPTRPPGRPAFAAAAVAAPRTCRPPSAGWPSGPARRPPGRPRWDLPLGHQAARLRVGGYAAYALAGLEPAELEEIEDELFRFARVVESTPALRPP